MAGARLLTVHAERSRQGFVLYLLGTDGRSFLGECPATADIFSTARRNAARLLGVSPQDIDLDLQVDPPSGIENGARVRVLSVDDEQTWGREGVVVGFIQGGVAVQLPGSGVGIYPAEEIEILPDR